MEVQNSSAEVQGQGIYHNSREAYEPCSPACACCCCGVVANCSPSGLLEIIAFRDSLLSVISSGLHSLANRVHAHDLTATIWPFRGRVLGAHFVADCSLCHL